MEGRTSSMVGAMDIVKCFTDVSDAWAIRICGTMDDPLFLGLDVGRALGLKDFNRVLRTYPEKYKAMVPIQTNGGMQEAVFLNERGLYKTIMTSRVPAAERFQDWVFSVIKEIRQHGRYDIQEQLARRNAAHLAEIERVRHQSLIQGFQNRRVIYFLKICRLADGFVRIKVGSSKDITQRYTDYNTNFPGSVFVHVIEAVRHDEFETHMHNCHLLHSYHCYEEINGVVSNEIFDIPGHLLQEAIEYGERKAIEYRMVNPCQARLADRLMSHYELTGDKAVLDLIGKALDAEINAANKIADVQDEDVPEVGPSTPLRNGAVALAMDRSDPGSKAKKITQGSYVQKYDLQGYLIETYEGLTDAVRRNTNVSATGLTEAIKNNSEYYGYRWVYLSRLMPSDTVQAIGPTIKRQPYRAGLVALMDIDRTTILGVFASQKELAEHLNVNGSLISHTLTRGGICNGHTIKEWDVCSKELQEAYLKDNTLPVRTRHKAVRALIACIDPVSRQTVKTFQSASEVMDHYNCNRTSINRALDNDIIWKGYQWHRLEDKKPRGKTVVKTEP